PMHSTAGTPPELRGLAALILVDAAVGAWLTLNAPGALPIYLSGHVPALGIGGIIWNFLPDRPKKFFGSWLARQLAKPGFLRTILGIGSVALLASGIFSTVTVRSADPQGITDLHAVYGSFYAPDTAVQREGPTRRLSRLATQARWFFMAGPTGKQ